MARTASTAPAAPGPEGKLESLKAIGLTVPATLVYALGLPLLAIHLDREHATEVALPEWVRALGALIAAAGLVVAARSSGLLVGTGRGSPNPIRPTRHLVTSGAYARSRNPMMLAGWTFGAGVAVALSSPTLLGLYALVVLGGVVYVRRIEEPALEQRFGAEYRRYASRVPRWLIVVALLAGSGKGLAAQEAIPTDAPAVTPAVVVRIDVEPGGTQAWLSLFEAHIAPSIRDAMAAGDVVGFEYFEGLVASESTDVILILRAESFAFFDQRRPFPHFRALFERVGVEEGRRIIAEMSSLERSVEVTLVRAHGGAGHP